MKIREWDEVHLIGTEETKKEKTLQKITFVKPLTLKRLNNKNSISKKDGLVPAKYVSIYSPIAILISKTSLYSKVTGWNIIILDVIYNSNIFFKFKHKIKNWGFKCKLWFISIVNRKPYFKKNPIKKN